MNMILYSVLVIFVFITTIFVNLFFSRRITLPFIFIYRKNRWSIGTIITDHPLNINKKYESIETLKWKKFNCIPKCVFMADPFVVENKGEYYIFYEHAPSTLNNPGADIWALQSSDLVEWKQLGPVLEEQFHLSFPNVFRNGNTWYMLPETGASKQIRLYRSDNFPMNWVLDSILVSDIISADPIIFEKEKVYYMLFQDNEDFTLRLYLSDNFKSGWHEHPSSPIRSDNNYTRPGGKIDYIDNRLIYLIQDESEGYGTGLHAFEIDQIDPYNFNDHKLSEDPVLYKNGNSWSKNGMHHLSWINLSNDKYFCVMDGVQQVETKIGWNWLNLPKIRL